MLPDMFEVFGNLMMIRLYFAYLSQNITTISFPLLLHAIRMGLCSPPSLLCFSCVSCDKILAVYLLLGKIGLVLHSASLSKIYAKCISFELILFLFLSLFCFLLLIK